MEKSKNRALIDFFKSIASALGRVLASDDEINNDVELPAELSGDPIAALNEFQSSQETVQRVSQSRTRAPKAPTRNVRSQLVDKDEPNR